MLHSLKGNLHPADPLATLRALLARGDGREYLFEAALQISAIEHPDLPAGWVKDAKGRLHALVVEAAHRVPQDLDVLGRFELLGRFLFGDAGFAGNRENFADPRNSCLIDVLERRVGIPITLAVVQVAVGHELGIPVEGIGAPGHFLTAVALDSGARIFCDPFNQGRLFGVDEARERVRVYAGPIPTADADLQLRNATNRDVVLRMLNNMKSVYAQETRMRRLVTTLNWILALQPDNLEELRNRGLVLLRLGELRRGGEDLARYLEQCPEAPDRSVILSELARARSHRILQN